MNHTEYVLKPQGNGFRGIKSDKNQRDMIMRQGVFESAGIQEPPTLNKKCEIHYKQLIRYSLLKKEFQCLSCDKDEQTFALD